MAKEEKKWVAFDDDEALSLCDLPVDVDKGNNSEKKDEEPECPAVEDFEFRTSVGGGLFSKAAELDMCAADEVFFMGQILPLRASLSSDNGLLPPSRDRSRCGSRSDSMEHYSSTISSSAFGSSRSISISSRSSSCISRSQSSNSCSSLCEPPRSSVSNNFYAHPSPTPQVRLPRKSNAGRKSASSPPTGWGLFRLGLVKTPEIEYLHDLRDRKENTSRGINRRNCESDTEKKELRPSDGKGDKKIEKRAGRFLGLGFSCKCSPDAVDTISSRILITKKKEEGLSLRKEESLCHSRTFEWLEELDVTKST